MARNFCWHAAARAFALACPLLLVPAHATGLRAPGLGLPAIAEPADNPSTPEKIRLGRELFFDKRFSGDGKVSCATCHDPDKAFADGKPVAEGIDGRRGNRNTPTVLDAAYNAAQFWDGRRATLEEQVLDPMFDANEHGLKSRDQLVGQVRADDAYAAWFRRAFSVERGQITAVEISRALAAFVRSLVSGNSPADRYLYGGDKAALSPEQIRGLDIFRGHAQCASCHQIGERAALLIDGDYHSLSVGFERLAPKLASLARQLAHASGDEKARIVQANPETSTLGRFLITLDPRDIGKFKTPSLRNVALTGPYMHDGSIATLEGTVNHEIYYRGRAQGRPLILTPREKEDLVAFMNAWTSPNLPR